MKTERFTIKEFEAKYPTDDTCLEDIFQRRFKKFRTCPNCFKPFKYYRVSGRKCYACQSCGHQLHPLADTIFHKSSTPLKYWFYAIYLFSVSKNGVSAKELERQLGVTYKTAWRMAQQIRLLFEDDNQEPLSHIVEIDETYMGGKQRGKRGRGSENKTPIIGATERNGEIRAKVVKNIKSSTVRPFIRDNVKFQAVIMTDEFATYDYLSKIGCNHSTVNHGQKEYVRGIVHTNTIEGFWSQLKRSIDGTYHSVSPKYLQKYLNEFSFRYNNRKRSSLFEMVLRQAIIT